jgi:hypothetical protein
MTPAGSRLRTLRWGVTVKDPVAKKCHATPNSKDGDDDDDDDKNGFYARHGRCEGCSHHGLSCYAAANDASTVCCRWRRRCRRRHRRHDGKVLSQPPPRPAPASLILRVADSMIALGAQRSTRPWIDQDVEHRQDFPAALVRPSEWMILGPRALRSMTNPMYATDDNHHCVIFSLFGQYGRVAKMSPG